MIIKVTIFVLNLYILNVLCFESTPHNKMFSTLNHIKPKSTPETQATTVQDLISRTLPAEASLFDVKVDPDLGNNDLNDVFRLEKLASGIIQITGTTGVAAAAGFNHYLKYFCNSHISWEASQLNLPEELPDVDVTVPFNDRFRYYQNVCTTSYSFVWWDWNQWEKHIDWIALNGFNLVLAFNGQEAIWDRVYQKFNLTREDIDEHFTGPAFLAWLRMGNMRGWGGPLSSAWHDRSIVLQKQILERMRNFGMIPVLPAFAGHLPRAFRSLYPDAKMDMMGAWNGFSDEHCCPYFLDPTENLFNEIGTAFVAEQISEFGTDHVYSCDSFNENRPTSGDLTYLENVGKSIYKAMTDADSEAIWLMQNWMFVNEFDFWTLERAKSILTSVPIGKMIVLDLQSERSPQYQNLEQYFGQPFIWCMLHNFGGTLGMFGSSTMVNYGPRTARQAENSTMIGTGLTPEGINQNYVIYELMTESAWRTAPVNLTEWIESYTTRRYGSSDDNAKNAWRILQRTIYDFSESYRIMGQFVIAKSPNFQLLIQNWYPMEDLLDAWTSLLAASDNLQNSPGYLHDLVDVTRQVLQVYGDQFYTGIVDSYTVGDVHSFDYYSVTFLDLLTDLERILATNEAFLLGRWVQSAKDAAADSNEEMQFEQNAKNQITLWGPRGEILDYATKQWSGVVSNFFYPRWKMFLDYANNTLLNGETFDQSYINNQMFTELEQPFTVDQTEFPTEPTGDTIQIARNIHDKWSPIFKSSRKNY
jgi:alpha-N-acetylglucosaminidase